MSGPIVDSAAMINVLDHWLLTRLTAEQTAWLHDRCQTVATGDKKALYLAFGLVSRKLTKADLKLSGEELILGNQTRPGWDAAGWTIEQAARARLLL